MTTTIETWAKRHEKYTSPKVKTPSVGWNRTSSWLGISFYTIYQLRKVSKSLNVNTLWLAIPTSRNLCCRNFCPTKQRQMHKDFPCSSIYYIGKLEKSFYIKSRMVQKKVRLVKRWYKLTVRHHITIKKAYGRSVFLNVCQYINIASIYCQVKSRLKISMLFLWVRLCKNRNLCIHRNLESYTTH